MSNKPIIKLSVVISNIDKSLTFEAFDKNIDREKFKVNYLLLNPRKSQFEDYLKSKGREAKTIPLHSKKNYPKIIWKLYRYWKQYKPDIIHAHLLDASLLALFSARLAGIKNRIHTRHHATMHHEYFPRGVKYDRLNNRLSSHIVCASSNVKNVLVDVEHVDEKRVSIIPFGFNLESVSKRETRVNKLRSKYNASSRRPVVGVISRYIHLKGIQYIIPAFKKLLDANPKALLILANAKGRFKEEINKLLAELPNESYKEITFENDIEALYGLFDVYVHVPINDRVEAFGQTYIEALAAGVPSIFTISGIAKEFIQHEENAYVVDYKNEEQILEGMQKLLSDNQLAEKVKQNGLVSVQSFTIDNYVKKHEKLYQDLCRQKDNN